MAKEAGHSQIINSLRLVVPHMEQKTWSSWFWLYHISSKRPGAHDFAKATSMLWSDIPVHIRNSSSVSSFSDKSQSWHSYLDNISIILTNNMLFSTHEQWANRHYTAAFVLLLLRFFSLNIYWPMSPYLFMRQCGFLFYYMCIFEHSMSVCIYVWTYLGWCVCMYLKAFCLNKIHVSRSIWTSVLSSYTCISYDQAFLQGIKTDSY